MKLYHIYDKVKSVMMKSDFIFDDFDSCKALWIADGVTDTADLAVVADAAIGGAVPFVSVPVGVIKTFWPWVEGKNVKILTRFGFEISKNQNADEVTSEFAKNLTDAFRTGADGAQVFVPANQIAEFADLVRPIKSDLFFDRYLAIGIDVDHMGDVEWAEIFNAMTEIRPDAILLVGTVENFDPSSDFVGRVFDMLEKWNLESDLHMMFGKNMLRVTQVLRLVHKMRPELEKNMRVFVKK